MAGYSRELPLSGKWRYLDILAYLPEIWVWGDAHCSKSIQEGHPAALIMPMAWPEDFATHGAAVIEKVRTDKPDAYLKIVASLLPKDINLNVRPLDELSDDQLLVRLAQLTEMAKPLLAKFGG
jgi:hypothetical protein